jgi:hypothetical protein
MDRAVKHYFGKEIIEKKPIDSWREVWLRLKRA